MCEIALCELSWEAVATVLAGFMAIAGAIYVGRKQNKILIHQTQLSDLTLKNELFDRRVKIYETVDRWTKQTYTTGFPPEMGSDLDHKFIKCSREAKFLFKPQVSKTLTNWHLLACNLYISSSAGEHLEARKYKKDLLDELNSEKVFNLFEPEMNLTSSKLEKT